MSKKAKLVAINKDKIITQANYQALLKRWLG